MPPIARVPCLISVLAVLLLAGLPASSAAQTPASAAAKTHVVTIEGMRFLPQTLVVHRGERVTWINKDLFPHTATARNGAFDSHSIAAGASWTFVAGKAGTYHYACTFHPSMTGTLTVR